MTVFCLIETDANGAADSSIRALAFGRALAASAGPPQAGELAAAWFGPVGAVSQAQLAAAGMRRGYAIGSAELTGYAPLAWARALSSLVGAQPSPGRASAPASASAPAPAPAPAASTAAPFSAIVAASTDRGNEVLAHLAALTGLPMAANCVSATWAAAGECRLVRQRWAGSLLEEAVLTGPVALLTVATDALPTEPSGADPAPGADSVAAAEPVPGADPAAAAGPVAGADPAAAGPGAGTPSPVPVEVYTPEFADGDLLVTATESAERSGGVSLATARVVIGGGRGVGSPAGFAVLEELAGLLGAAVGVSRVVTSQGWRPHRQQVGQTGTKIAPELYLACGISGAIQHMAGCQSAKTIIAINTDAGAPIVARADYAVIGDLHQILPALIAALRARAGVRQDQ